MRMASQQGNRVRGNPRRPRTRIAAALLAGLLFALVAACDDDGATAPAAPAGDRVLTVEEALARPLGSTLTVSGALFADGPAPETVRLCSAIAESYPPQCAGAAIELVGVDLGAVPGLQRVEDRAWSDDPFEATGVRTAIGLRIAP